MTLVFQLLLFVVHELHHDLVNDIFDLIMSSTSWNVVTISSDQALRVGTRSKFEKRSNGPFNQILIRAYILDKFLPIFALKVSPFQGVYTITNKCSTYGRFPRLEFSLTGSLTAPLGQVCPEISKLTKSWLEDMILSNFCLFLLVRVSTLSQTNAPHMADSRVLNSPWQTAWRHPWAKSALRYSN